MNTFSFTRVSLILKELWNANKWRIFSIPLVMILLFWLYYMLPGSIYHPFLNHHAESKDWRFLTIINKNTFLKITILGVIPIYLYVCMSGYLRQLKTNFLSVLTPVSVSERVFAIWIFSLGLIFVLLSFFFLTDYLFVHIHRFLFWDETINILEANGDLYYDFGGSSVFSVLNLTGLQILPLVGICLITLPLLFLVCFKMRNAAILIYPLSGTAVFLLLFPTVPFTVAGNYLLSISLSPLFLLVYSVFVTGLYVLWMAAFYFMVKENEV